MVFSKKFMVTYAGWSEIVNSVKSAHQRGFKFGYCRYTKNNYRVSQYLVKLGYLNSCSNLTTKKKKTLQLGVNQKFFPKIKRTNSYKGIAKY